MNCNRNVAIESFFTQDRYHVADMGHHRLFYRCYSSPGPRDALYHQQQAILRNSTCTCFSFSNKTVYYSKIQEPRLLGFLHALSANIPS